MFTSIIKVLTLPILVKANSKYAMTPNDCNNVVCDVREKNVSIGNC